MFHLLRLGWTSLPMFTFNSSMSWSSLVRLFTRLRSIFSRTSCGSLIAYVILIIPKEFSFAENVNLFAIYVVNSRFSIKWTRQSCFDINLLAERFNEEKWRNERKVLDLQSRDANVCTIIDLASLRFSSNI